MDTCIKYKQAKTVGTFRRGDWDDPKYVFESPEVNPDNPLFNITVYFRNMTDKEFKAVIKIVDEAVEKVRQGV